MNDEVYAMLIEPVTSNLRTMRSLAKTKGEHEAVDTLEWFFGLRELPPPTLAERLRWRILDLWYAIRDLGRGDENAY